MGARKIAQVSAVLIVLVAIAIKTFQEAIFSFTEEKCRSLCYGSITALLGVMVAICIDIISLNPADSFSFRGMLDQYFWLLTMQLVGWWNARQIEKCSSDMKKQQEKVLFEILDMNKSTDYAKDHGFDKIKSVEQYQKEIPFGTYDRIAPYVERFREGDLKAMTNDPVDAVVYTSGTTGKNKFFPMTKHVPVTNFVACKEYSVMMKTGRTMGRLVMVFHNYQRQKPLKKGQPSTLNMSSFAFPHHKFWLYPEVVFNIVEEPAFLYGAAVFSLREREVTGLKAVFAPMMFSFFATINQHWRKMCDEIEQGFINKGSMDVDDDVLKEINSYLSPDPERAEQLRKELNKGMKNITRRIWPKAGFCEMVATGSLAPPALLLADQELMGIPIISTFLAASEVMSGVNIMPDIDNLDYTLYPLKYFYEWVPEDHVGEKNPATILTHEMEIGKNYEMVATSYAGLARYRTWDVLKVERKLNQCPILSFQYRFNQMLNVGGEKLNESVFVQVFLKFCKDVNLPLADFTATESYRLYNFQAFVDDFGDARESRPRYCVFVEQQPDTPRFDLNEEQIKKFDKALAAAYECYGQFRGQDIIGLPQMFLVEQGTFGKVKLILIKDTQTQQFKMPRSMTKDEPLEFLISRRIK